MQQPHKLKEEDQSIILLTSDRMQEKQFKKAQSQRRSFWFFIGVLIVLLICITFFSRQWEDTTTKGSDLVSSPTAKKILEDQKKSVAKKITFTPNQQYDFSREENTDKSLENLILNIKQPKPFLGIKRSTQFDELPFCVGLLSENPTKVSQLKQSLSNQDYSNFETFTLVDKGQTLEKGNINLYNLNSILKKQCKQNSIIMLISGPIATNFLQTLNQIYQSKNVWLIYQLIQGQVLIHSVYQRVLQLLDKNDFHLDNMNYMGKPNHKIIALGLIQLSLNHAQNVEKYQKLTEEHHRSVTLRVNIKQAQNYKRSSYDPADSLRQAFNVDMIKNAQFYLKMLNNKEKKYVAQQAGVTQEKMLYSLQYLQLLYLPPQHFLAKRQKQYFESKYQLSKIKKQLPLCVCVPSHNNIDNDRYQRVMLSIIQQEYQNYHIVFIDDLSDDQTLSQTMRFMKDKNFPDDRVVYIENLERNFATYNIINSALNYCDNDQIQVIVDGDDELVGRMIFKLINYFYQYRDNWIVYTSFISNEYTYGTCHPFLKMTDVIDEKGKRTKGHWIGHLTTWYVAFLKLIKPKDHKKVSGQWYDTLYDDAFQHPLLEMAGPDHVEFIPEVGYIYNRNYGDNDDSSREKVVKRWNLYLQLIQRRPYQRINSFDLSYQNIQLSKELSQDYGKRYRQVNSNEIVSLRSKKLKILKMAESSEINGQTEILKKPESEMNEQKKSLKILKSEQNFKQKQKYKIFSESLINKINKVQLQGTIKKTKQPKMENQLTHLHPLENFTKPNFSNFQKFLDVLSRNNNKYNTQKLTIDENKIKDIMKKATSIGQNHPDDDLQTKMFLAYNLAIEPYNLDYLQAQYYMFEKIYELDKKVQQIPFCIAVIGRNNQLFFNYQYDSILRQNYSNYKIYFVDDHSDNNALELFQNYLKLIPKEYQDKTTIIKNSEVHLALYNRHKTIKNNCQPGDLVLDLDSDDWMIGNQVLNILNHHFQKKKDLWLFYSNIISVSENKGITHKPIDFYPEDIMEKNSFRQWGYFKTSQLRVFYFDLYNKIDQKDYTNEFGQYYSWNSDMFMQYSLMELSCPKHCQKVDQFFYFYNYQQTHPRPRIIKQYEKMISLTQIPYKKLDSLKSPAHRQDANDQEYATNVLSKILKKMKNIQQKKRRGPTKAQICTLMNIQLLETFKQFQIFYRQSKYYDNPNFKFVNFATFQIEDSQINELNKANKYLKHYQKKKQPKKPMKRLTFDQIFNIINTQCQNFQNIVFAKNQLNHGSLEQIGSIMKDKKIWLVYDGQDNGFYANIFAIKKGFLSYVYNEKIKEFNRQILDKNYDFIVIPLLQIGNGHALRKDTTEFFKSKFASLIGINNNKYSKNRFLNFSSYEPISQYE